MSGGRQFGIWKMCFCCIFNILLFNITRSCICCLVWSEHKMSLRDAAFETTPIPGIADLNPRSECLEQLSDSGHIDQLRPQRDASFDVTDKMPASSYVNRLINIRNPSCLERSISWKNISHESNVNVNVRRLQVFILHSSMQTSDQKKVLKNTPKGVRKIVRTSLLSLFSQSSHNPPSDILIVYPIQTSLCPPSRFCPLTSQRPASQSMTWFLSLTLAKWKRYVTLAHI